MRSPGKKIIYLSDAQDKLHRHSAKALIAEEKGGKGKMYHKLGQSEVLACYIKHVRKYARTSGHCIFGFDSRQKA